MGAWDDWIGRAVRAEDRLDEARAKRWHATFDVSEAASGAMPQGIHFCLCTPDAATASLGEDGHPVRSNGKAGLLPPVPLPRRMWAGSGIVFHRPIAAGEVIVRTSSIASISEKSGGSGSLVFVDVDHAMSAEGALAVVERQTLVYRNAAQPDAPLSPPEASTGDFNLAEWDASRSLIPDPRLLFRYSALTFNTHRIHYDLPYARDVERYRGLVVHGPLIATLLLQLAGGQFGDNRLGRFVFRAVSPAIVGEQLHLVMRGAGDMLEMAAFADDGRQVTKAEAVLR